MANFRSKMSRDPGSVGQLGPITKVRFVFVRQLQYNKLNSATNTIQRLTTKLIMLHPKQLVVTDS